MNHHRAAVFGDVHGDARKLEQLIKLIREEYGDIQLYSTGDLIDRGPDSKGVIDLCIQENVLAVMGNHELWLRQYIETKVLDTFAFASIMGGTYTMDSYGLFESQIEIFKGLHGVIPESHKKFISSLPLLRHFEIDEKKFWVCHGGVKPSMVNNVLIGLPPDQRDIIPENELLERACQQGEDTLLWGFNTVKITDSGIVTNLYQPKTGTQIFGHSIYKKPVDGDSLIAIDTGCGTANPFALTAVILPERRFISIDDSGWI